jgi:hypothetical protein
MFSFGATGYVTQKMSSRGPANRAARPASDETYDEETGGKKSMRGGKVGACLTSCLARNAVLH